MDRIDRESVLAELSRHIGKVNGITCADLVRAITWRAPDQASMRRLRKVIESLRMEGHHICGHPSAGYFIAANERELNETCKFLADRALTSLAQAARMKKLAIPDIHGQLRLPS